MYRQQNNDHYDGRAPDPTRTKRNADRSDGLFHLGVARLDLAATGADETTLSMVADLPVLTANGYHNMAIHQDVLGVLNRESAFIFMLDPSAVQQFAEKV